MEGYIISDVAKELQIEPHVLRYWEDELKLDIKRNKLGHRLYTRQDIDTLLKIKHLKEKGLRLKAIKLMLMNGDKKEEAKERSSENQIIKRGEVVSSNMKLKQFQEFMKDIVHNALKENNDTLKIEVIKGMSAQMQDIAQAQEAMEEKKYRKLDETIREIQKMRQEIAACEKDKKKSFLKSLYFK